jgi:hypothetical protein
MVGKVGYFGGSSGFGGGFEGGCEGPATAGLAALFFVFVSVFVSVFVFVSGDFSPPPSEGLGNPSATPLDGCRDVDVKSFLPSLVSIFTHSILKLPLGSAYFE